MKPRSPYPALFATLLATLSATGCWGVGAEEPPTSSNAQVNSSGSVVLSDEQMETLDLRTELARSRSLRTTDIRFGVVVAPPDDDVLIIAPAQGRIQRVVASLGDPLTRGALVAVLVPIVDTASQANLTARVAEIHAQIAAGKERIKAARVELRGVSRLAKARLATRSQRAQAQATLASERSLLEGLEQSERALQAFAGGQIELSTPSAGRVAEIHTRVGSFVRQGDTLARVVRSGPRWIDVSVALDETPGLRYRVPLGDRSLDAHLLTRGLLAHGGTRTDRIEVEEDDSATLLPGRAVTIQVVHETSGTVVPRRAVVRTGGARLCFVETRPGTYEPRHIRVGENDGSDVIVTQGVVEGEAVVVRGAGSLLGTLGRAGRLGSPTAHVPGAMNDTAARP